MSIDSIQSNTITPDYTVATNSVGATSSEVTTTPTALSVSDSQQSVPTTNIASISSVDAGADLYALDQGGSASELDWLGTFFDSLRPKEQSLLAGTDKEGNMWVKTADGYTIRFAGKDQKWTITSRDGRTTTIWGDPHVIESDQDTWDFTESSTFEFGANKITVDTIKSGGAQAYTSKVTIYSGEERFSVSNIDDDKPKFVAWKSDGEKHDAALADGTTYVLKTEPNGEDIWVRR